VRLPRRVWPLLRWSAAGAGAAPLPLMSRLSRGAAVPASVLARVPPIDVAASASAGVRGGATGAIRSAVAAPASAFAERELLLAATAADPPSPVCWSRLQRLRPCTTRAACRGRSCHAPPRPPAPVVALPPDLHWNPRGSGTARTPLPLHPHHRPCPRCRCCRLCRRCRRAAVPVAPRSRPQFAGDRAGSAATDCVGSRRTYCALCRKLYPLRAEKAVVRRVAGQVPLAT